MAPEHKIRNAMKRSEVVRKEQREKAQAKLKRRMENRKAEKQKGIGEQLKKERLAKNIPRTQENTREYDGSSYLTANPADLRAAAERAAEASKRVNQAAENPSDDEEEEEDDEDEDMPEAGPSTGHRAPVSGRASENGITEDNEDEEGEGDENGQGVEEETEQFDSIPITPTPPPRILITTSISPCKDTYIFCEELKNLFPGGEFFRRPKGKGFEMGRICRWGAKRGFNAMLVVNEDHKKANAITLINLPAGPTAYLKLTSIQLGKTIYGHARPTPHSPELILNNFTTLLGHAVGRLFGSLFPPMPQFRGRQVVTLHNQRDFLFFRRHRYAFSSATSAKLQEIGPRFTLRLRWLRNGLPAVTAGDGRVSNIDSRGAADDEEGDMDVDADEKMEEEEALRDIGKPQKTPTDEELGIPALDDQQEYEWKWKPKMDKSRRMFYL